MTYDDIKDRTSSAVGTDGDGGILFDETIEAYSERRRRARDFLSEAVIESNQKAFRAYLQQPQWAALNDEPSAGKASSAHSFDHLDTLS